MAESTPGAPRTPVGVAAVPDNGRDQGYCVVVCSDGSCWTMYSGGWEAYSPIPGTPAALTLETPDEH